MERKKESLSFFSLSLSLPPCSHSFFFFSQVVHFKEPLKFFFPFSSLQTSDQINVFHSMIDRVDFILSDRGRCRTRFNQNRT